MLRLARVPGLRRQHRVASCARAVRPPPRSILDVLSLDYHETIMAAAGHQAEAKLATRRSRSAPARYIAIVEGSIPTGANGAYCTIGGRVGARHRARGLRRARRRRSRSAPARRSAAFPAAAPNPTGALGVADAVPGVKNLINLLGVPGQRREPDGAARLLPDLQALAAARSLPPAALRLRQVDPRQLRAARALRRRPVRRGVGRRRPSRRLLPLQDGLQGAGRRSRTARTSAGTAAPTGRSAAAIRASAAPSRTSGTR